MKPRIGVTGPDHGGLIAWVFTFIAVARAGGRAVRLTPRRRRSIDGLDGLVVGGGVDIGETLPDDEDFDDAPSLPGRILFWLTAPFRALARRLSHIWRDPETDLARDLLEVQLLRRARERNLPVLGICRGAQLMARVEDGELVEDVGDRFEDRPALWTPFPARDVVVDPDSHLHEVLGSSRHRVNSLHRHAIASIPAPLKIVAREAEHPIAQAIEHPGRRFWIGVQWHPEYLPQRAAQRSMFRRLVEAARASRTDDATARDMQHLCA